MALARALVLRPRVLLLDEPTANLDAGLALRTEALLREAGHAWGATVVFSTHNFPQAARLAGTILYLSEGRRSEPPPWDRPEFPSAGASAKMPTDPRNLP